MKIFLINCGFRIEGEQKYKETLGPSYIASACRMKGYETAVFDGVVSNLTTLEAAELVSKCDDRFIIGFSVMLWDWIYDALDLLNYIEKKKVKPLHVTMGGAFPTVAYDEILGKYKKFDSIILGEGEYTFVELVTRLDQEKNWRDIPGIAYIRKNGEVTKNIHAHLIQDLDMIPFPSRDHLNLVLRNKRMPSVLTSRGCYGNCSYCLVNAFYKDKPGPRWRGRSPKNVVDEIETLVRRWHISFIDFFDENFIGPGKYGKERVHEIADEIIKRGLNIKFRIFCRANDVEKELFSHMKKAGLNIVFLGLESGVQHVLDIYNKRTTIEINKRALEILKQIDMNIDFGFIMIEPFSSIKEVKENLKFLRENVLGCRIVGEKMLGNLYQELIVFKKTPIYNLLLQKGLLRGSCDEDPFIYNYVVDKQVKVFQKAIKLTLGSLRDTYKFLDELLGEKKIPYSKKIELDEKVLYFADEIASYIHKKNITNVDQMKDCLEEISQKVKFLCIKYELVPRILEGTI